MGKLKFNVGDKVINKRETDKNGTIVGYHKRTGEYQVLLQDGTTHFESPRWLEKAGNE